MGLIYPLDTLPITLREQIFQQVHKLIATGELRPGDRVRERELAEQLGVSRTPLREALILLERDDLLVNYPNRGYIVNSFDEEDIREIYTLRTALENLAAQLVIDKLTQRHFSDLEHLIAQQLMALEHDDLDALGGIDHSFHSYLVGLSENARLINYWRGIWLQHGVVVYYRGRAYPDYDEYLMIKDHRRILDAYKSGDLQQVIAANTDINRRVAEQSIAGFRLSDTEFK